MNAANSAPRFSIIQRSVALPLLVLPLLTVLLVSPSGEFPVIDDSKHFDQVKMLLEQHRYVGGPPIVSTLVAQALWGAAFAKVLGLSYTTLRVSTIVLAYLGAWVMARAALAAGASRPVALIAGALLWCNPYYFVYAYSFMTEVPFVAACTASGLFYLLALQHGRARDIVLGSMLALIAFFIRQHGVLLFGAMGAALSVALVIDRDRPRTKQFLVWLGTAVVGAAIVLIWMQTRAHVPQQDAWLSRIFRVDPVYKVMVTAHYAVIVLAFAGLYTLPYLVLRITRLIQRDETWPWWRWAVVSVIAVGGTLFLHYFTTQFRYGPDVAHNLGTPVYYSLSSDNSLDDTQPPMQFPAPIKLLLAFASLFQAGILITGALATAATTWNAARAKTRLDASALQQIFLIAWFVLFVASYAVFIPAIYWRYMVQMTPPIILFAAIGVRGTVPRTQLASAWVPLAATYIILLAILQDQMAWSGARWVAADKLVKEMQIPPSEINGGWEFNFHYTDDEYRQLQQEKGNLPYKGRAVINDTYALSYGPRKDYEEIDRVPYYSWLGFQERHIFILKRTEASSVTTPDGSAP